MFVRLRRLRLATQLFLLQVMVVGLVVVAGTAVVLVYAQRDARADARRRVLDVARTFAASPDVLAALHEPDPAGRLQPLAETVRHGTGVDFVVVMNIGRVRYSHPDVTQIGHPFLGHVDPALRGRSFTETYTGTLGPSIRAVVPVAGAGGHVEGLVATGITTTRVSEQLTRRMPAMIWVSALGFTLAALGALLVSRRLWRQTLGLGPEEITRMYEHHDAVLHSVREGVLVLDREHRLVLANDEAVRLIDLSPGAEGAPAAGLSLPSPLRDLLVSGRTVTDEIHLTDERVLVVNQLPATRGGRRLGTVTTLRDHTELEALSGELNSIRGFTEALRAQAHEAANRLHTVITLVELGRTEEAVRFATAELATAQELTDRLLGSVTEPVLAALLLGKAAQANERGVELVITDDTALGGTAIEPRDLVTLVGNLIDNAIDAALAAPPPRRVFVTAREDGDALLVRVSDTGAGLDPAHIRDAFTRGWSTKQAKPTTPPASTERHQGRGLGLGLVQQIINRYGGDIDVSRNTGAVFTVRLPLPERAAT
ncbi:MAG: signal transduction histidine kinase regulating citrate/malate metabolism [Streptosporangiaceae bacterium]|jgi:two-component system CitB family sensor kinase|nr:signal transduction histidine kinase regulating citrate/malate metabolism [Streptosporangiaceae bacterium]